jgi:hypothetical protein
VAASILTGVCQRIHLARSRYDLSSSWTTPLGALPGGSRFAAARFSAGRNIRSGKGSNRGLNWHFDRFRDNPDIFVKSRKLDNVEEVPIHSPDKKIALPCAEDIRDVLFMWLAENRSRNAFNFIGSIGARVLYVVPEDFQGLSSQSCLRSGEGQWKDVSMARIDQQISYDNRGFWIILRPLGDRI